MNRHGIVYRKPDGAFGIRLRRHQLAAFEQVQQHRFTAISAHRRFGKSVLALVTLILAMHECSRPRPQGFYVAPTYSQAKRVAWSYLREFCESIPGTDFNESELKVTLPNGAVIRLASADNIDSLRGIYADFVVLDEPAQQNPEIWSKVLRPALSDRQGKAMFIGTPAGRHGLLYDAFVSADSGDPDWWATMYKASETGIIDEAELSSARRSMSQAEFEQEFETSWDAAIKGAYYTTEMAKAEAAGRISFVPHDSGKQVHIALDLGISDSTAAWFVQLSGEQVRLIDCAEYQGMGLPAIVAEWRTRGYNFGKIIVPHDVKVRELSTGITRLETLRSLGCDCLLAPNMPVADGIEQVRRLLSRCSFDRENCRHGVEALRAYASEWDEKRGVLKLSPIHNWASHLADSLRYLAVTGTDALAGVWGGPIDYSHMDRANLSGLGPRSTPLDRAWGRPRDDGWGETPDYSRL